MIMQELNEKQINRQDYVDNVIYTLINDVNICETEIDWDIELIADIRETIRVYFEAKLSKFDEMKFYPYCDC